MKAKKTAKKSSSIKKKTPAKRVRKPGTRTADYEKRRARSKDYVDAQLAAACEELELRIRTVLEDVLLRHHRR